jgi:hypothetical protein
MTHLDENTLATVLRQVTPEPGGPSDAGSARRRAGRMRQRRRALLTGAAVVVALAVALPTVLSSWLSSALSSGRLDDSTRGAAGPATVLAEIERPLRLPSLAAGQSCPVSPTRRLPAGAGFTGPFTARGVSPFYVAAAGAVPLGPTRTTRDGGRWRDQKVIWVVDGTYAGPVLVRGGRIDRPGPLRFLRYIGAYGYTGGAGDDRPARSLLYNWYDRKATPDGSLSSFPSGIFVRAPGCYALQVDGVDFSERLVFRVAG